MFVNTTVCMEKLTTHQIFHKTFVLLYIVLKLKSWMPFLCTLCVSVVRVYNKILEAIALARYVLQELSTGLLSS